MAKVSWKEALDLERDIAILIREQEKNGVYFKYGKAIYLLSLLDRLKEEQYDIIRPYLKRSVLIGEKIDKNTGEYKWVHKISNLNGSYTISVEKHYGILAGLVEGPFSRIEIEEPDLSKRSYLTNTLLKMGWKPEVFTDKGTPKITVEGVPVESLEEVGPFGKALSSWYTYAHRRSQINGFLQHVDDRSRIAAAMDTCGTNTFRCKHRVVANIPRPTSVFGKEMRSLFSVPEGRMAIGADVSGLEVRLLAHHMNDLKYIDLILNGDIHEYNKELAGLPTRDNAKTFLYGTLYGAGDAKTGRIIGGSSKEGKKIKETFYKNLPSLSKLSNKVRKFAEARGYLPAIDGRKIYIRSFEGRVLTHTALNALLQANGSIVVKRWVKISNDKIKAAKLDCQQVIFMHDELFLDCDPEDADQVRDILLESVREAGEFYNLRIRLDADVKYGIDWSIH